MRNQRIWFIAGGGVAVLAMAALLITRTVTRTEVKSYDFTGTVLSVTPEANKISARNADMPGFMESMVMDYQLKDAAILSKLKRGDEIRATLRSDGEAVWILENVTVTKPGTPASAAPK